MEGSENPSTPTKFVPSRDTAGRLQQMQYFLDTAGNGQQYPSGYPGYSYSKPLPRWPVLMRQSNINSDEGFCFIKHDVASELLWWWHLYHIRTKKLWQMMSVSSRTWFGISAFTSSPCRRGSTVRSIKTYIPSEYLFLFDTYLALI